MGFKDWLPSVLQFVTPYVSSEDIDKGARWSSDIAKELETSAFGILCITQENINAPWIHFEAGALSKTMDKARVCPFLFGVKRSEIQGPLLQFQSVIYEQEDVKKLVVSLNASCTENMIDEARLADIFDVWWPRLRERLDSVKTTADQWHSDKIGAGADQIDEEKRNAILEEVLELSRQQQRLLRSPAELLPPAYLAEVLAQVAPSAPNGLAQRMTWAMRVLADIGEELDDVHRWAEAVAMSDESPYAKHVEARLREVTHRLNAMRQHAGLLSPREGQPSR